MKQLRQQGLLRARLLLSLLLLSVAANIYLYHALSQRQALVAAVDVVTRDIDATAVLQSKEVGEIPLSAQQAGIAPQSSQGSIALDAGSPQSLRQREVHSTPEVLVAEQALALFDARQFQAAVAEYSVLVSRDAQVALEIKLLWVESAQRWLAEGERETAQQFVDAFLHRFPAERLLHLLQSDLYFADDKPKLAIATLYDLVRESTEGRNRESDLGKARELSTALAKGLLQDSAWQPLLSLAETLVFHEPGYAPYRLMLARAYFELEDFYQSRVELRQLIDDPYFAPQAKKLLKAIELAELKEIAVPLVTKGEHYIVGGEIDRRNDVRLMIDTGASLSVLSEKYFNAQGLADRARYVRSARVNTAGGVVDAPIYQIDLFQIKQYQLRNMEFFVMELESFSSADGLLGMNFLREFNFQIDQKNSLLLLAPRK